MTCGVCHPEAFRPSEKLRRLAYVTAYDPMQAARDTTHLHYYGAETVFADTPHGNVRYRRAMKFLLKILRTGDTLILASLKALGTKTRRALRTVERIEALGVEVRIVPPERR